MHIKHMHEMIENLTECTKQALENNEVCVGQYPIGDVVDMIKDLNEAEYYAHISKAMDEAKEEDEEQDKYMLKRIKEEYGDDEEKTRRYYDDWRYMRSGRFAPKGRGTYTGRSRRGYEEMFMPEFYHDDPEYMRDVDRNTLERMYFSSPNMGNMSSNHSNSGNDGSDGRRNYGGDERRNNFGGGRDYREGRSGQRRRGYMETKELYNDNSPESKKKHMESLDSYLKDLAEDMSELVENMDASEKAMVKSRIQGLAQKIQ